MLFSPPLAKAASVAVLLGALASGGCVNVQPSGAPLPQASDAAHARLDAELAAVVADKAHPLMSLSALVVRDGKIVYHRQFGMRWIDPARPEQGKPADAATMYRIASISKLATTLGVLRLVEEGKLDLDADIGGYLGYRVRNPHFPGDPVTLRMLLTHTSSLRDDGGYYWEAGVDLKDVLTPGGALYGSGAMWAKNAKPGAYFQYANLPWGIAATVMERASGERFDRLMARLILQPMGLRGGFHPADFSAEDLANTATLYRKREATGFERWDIAGPWIPQVDDYGKSPPVPRAGPGYVVGSNGTAIGPAGGLRISAADLGRIMLMLMNKGMHEGKRILKPETVDLMLKTAWQRDDKGRNGDPNGESGFGRHLDFFNAWGLGTQRFLDLSGPNRGDRLAEDGGLKWAGHLGDAWGLTSAMVFDPERKNGMIYFVGGPGFNPETYPGVYSSFYRHEELILTALYRRAVLGRAE